jgi:hypothetical protein
LWIDIEYGTELVPQSCDSPRISGGVAVVFPVPDPHGKPRERERERLRETEREREREA